MLKYRCRLAAVWNLPFVSPFSILIELFVPRDPVTRHAQSTRDRAVTRVCFIDCPRDSMACAADWLVLTLNATWYNFG
jgi:hypothetical protein